MTTTRHQIELRTSDGGDWQFHATSPQMTAEQARELAADWNRKRRRSGEFRAVRITETREVLE